MCTGKGKLSACIFGAVNVVLYAIISFQGFTYHCINGNYLDRFLEAQRLVREVFFA